VERGILRKAHSTSTLSVSSKTNAYYMLCVGDYLKDV